MSSTPPPEQQSQAPEVDGATSVIDLVQAIRDRRLSSKQLTKEQRKNCVQYLGSEGLSVPEMAQLLGVSDRTIARDRAAIQVEIALEHDPKLAGQFAGKLVVEAEAAMARIRRFTRDREASIANKIEGERACIEILCKLSDQLQSLGFLPKCAGSMQIGIHHQAEQIPSIEEIDREIERLASAAERSGMDEATRKRLDDLKLLSTRAKAAQELQAIQTRSSQLKQEEASPKEGVDE